MAAFERLTHRMDIADAFEGEVGAAAGGVDDGFNDLVATDVIRVDEMGHAEFLRHFDLAGVQVHADDLVRANHAGALNDIEADAAEAEHHDIRARPDFCGIDDRTEASGDAAADVADLVEGRVLAHLGDGDFRQNREVRESRTAHVVPQNVIAAASRGAGEAAAAIWHDALPLCGADRRAEVGALRQAAFALPAFRRVERNDVIADLDRSHARADLADDAGAFMAENGRELALGIKAGECIGVGMANACGHDLDEHFTRLGAFKIDRFDGQGSLSLPGDGSAGFHGSDLWSVIRPALEPRARLHATSIDYLKPKLRTGPPFTSLHRATAGARA